MNQHNDHDFQQFRGQFDDEIMPSDSFKKKMENLLQSESPIEPERLSTVSASPSASPTVIPTARRSSPHMVAAAVLTAFAVVVASVWVLSGNVLEPDYASAPSGIPTVPADAPGTPGPDVYLEAEQYPGINTIHEYLGMHGGLLIVRGAVNLEVGSSDPKHTTTQEPNVNSDVLAAIDPDTGERIWEQPFHGFSAIAESEGVLVGMTYNFNNQQGEQTENLVALDLNTGEEIWSTVISTEHWTNYPAVVIEGGVVVTYEEIDTLTARDISTGKITWEAGFDPGEGSVMQFQSQDGKTREETRYNVAVGGWHGLIMVMNGAGHLQTFTTESGELTASHDLEWSQSDHAYSRTISIDPTDDGIVIFRQDYDGDTTATLTAMNPVDGQLLWDYEATNQHFIDVSADGSVAMQSVTFESPNWLERLLGRHGHSYRSLTWINGDTAEGMVSTEPGQMPADMGIPSAMTDGDYACTVTAEEEISCYNQIGTRYIVELKPLYAFDLVDGVLYIRTEDGLYRVNLP